MDPFISTLTMLILYAFCMQMRSFDIVPIMQIVADFTERYLKYPSFYLNRLFLPYENCIFFLKEGFFAGRPSSISGMDTVLTIGWTGSHMMTYVT